MITTKYRVWDKEVEEMFGVFSIDLVNELASYYGPKGLIEKRYGLTGDSNFPLNLMQYTGLKDQSCEEVFHKDIVDFEGTLYYVEWDYVNSGFYLMHIGYMDDPDSEEHLKGSCIRQSTIIGNRYEANTTKED